LDIQKSQKKQETRATLKKKSTFGWTCWSDDDCSIDYTEQSNAMEQNHF